LTPFRPRLAPAPASLFPDDTPLSPPCCNPSVPVWKHFAHPPTTPFGFSLFDIGPSAKSGRKSPEVFLDALGQSAGYLFHAGQALTPSFRNPFTVSLHPSFPEKPPGKGLSNVSLWLCFFFSLLPAFACDGTVARFRTELGVRARKSWALPSFNPMFLCRVPAACPPLLFFDPCCFGFLSRRCPLLLKVGACRGDTLSIVSYPPPPPVTLGAVVFCLNFEAPLFSDLPPANFPPV